MNRDEAITAIRAALRRRSAKKWSVRGGRGTSWGWITIIAPPKRCDEYGSMSESDRAELADLLGLDAASAAAHHQGVQIPASTQYRREYIARAEGRKPDVIGTPYWD